MNKLDHFQNSVISDYYEMMVIFPFDDISEWDFSSQYYIPLGNVQPFPSNVNYKVIIISYAMIV